MGQATMKLELTNNNDKDLQVLTKRIREETFPDSEGWTRLASVLKNLGKPKQAEEIYRILLTQESDESQMGAHYHQLGICKDDQGEYDEAIGLYQKVILIYEKYHPNSVSLASSYCNIGSVYRSMGEYAKALSYYEKDLAISQQSLPPNHLDLAASYNYIGSVYDDTKKYSEAYSFYEKAINIAERSLPLNHSHQKIYESNLDRMKKSCNSNCLFCIC